MVHANKKPAFSKSSGLHLQCFSKYSFETFLPSIINFTVFLFIKAGILFIVLFHLLSSKNILFNVVIYKYEDYKARSLIKIVSPEKSLRKIFVIYDKLDPFYIFVIYYYDFSHYQTSVAFRFWDRVLLKSHLLTAYLQCFLHFQRITWAVCLL